MRAAICVIGHIITFTCLCLLQIPLQAADTTDYILASGNPGTPYFNTAHYIADNLNQEFNHTRITAVNSGGSIDNIQRLEEGTADFIIVQRDAAVRAYYRNNGPLKNIEIVLPLFPEALHLFVKDKGGIIPFAKLKEMVNNGEIEKIAIGPENSTTHRTTRKVLNILGITTEDELFNTSPPSEYIDSFLNGSLKAIAFLASPPINHFFNSSNLDSIALVILSNPQVKRITSHLTNLDPISYSANNYPFLNENDTSIQGVGTWAFLAANPKTLNQTSERESIQLPKVLINNLLNDQGNPHLMNTYRGYGFFPASKENGILSIETQKINPSHFFRGLPTHKSLQSLFSINQISNYYYWLLLLVVLLIITYWFYIRRGRKIDLFKYWYRYKHFAIAGLFLIISYLVISELIIYFEMNFFETYSVKSPLFGLSKREIHAWLLIWIFTGYQPDVFPLSFGAQMLTTISVHLGIGTVGAAFLVEFIFSQQQKKRKQGMIDVKYKNHFVICGWNDRGLGLISKIKKALKEYVFESNNKICIVNTQFKDLIQSDEKIEQDIARKVFHYIQGEPTNSSILKKANIDKAKTVVLLADDNTRQADERTMLRAMAISKYCRNQNGLKVDSIYIVAEVNSMEFHNPLLEHDVNEVVCTGEMGNDVIVQSTINHGISTVLENILAYNDYNEFYTIDLRYNQALIGYNYEELFNLLRPYNILLLGIKAAYYENGKEIIDSKVIDKLMKEDERKPPRQVMINPTTPEEKAYTADGNDQLIVLARSGKSIDELKKIAQ